MLRLGRENVLPNATRLQLGLENVPDACVVDLNGYNQTVGALETAWSNALRNVTNSAAATATLTVNQRSNTIFAGVLSGPLSLVKQGGGRLTLMGTNAYTSVTHVDGGVLEIAGNGSVHSSPRITVGSSGTLVVPNGYTLSNGQRLEGTGTVQGNLILGEGATLAPGSGPGTLAVQSNLVMTNDSIFEVELNGTTPVSEYDQLQMSGTQLSLYSPALNVLLGFTPNVGDTFQIVTGFSAVSGTFNNLPDDSTFTVGSTQFQIDYGTSGITLIVVLEPATLGILLLGTIIVRFRRRRR